MPTRRANTRAFVAAVAACALTAAFAAPAPTTPRNPAAPREAVPSSLPRPTRAIFPSPRAFPPLGADRDRARPSGGETAPGAPDPVSVPFRQTPTYHPAYVPGGYASLGPHASRVATATVSAGFDGDFLYGFRSVVAVYPSALDRDDAPRHPIVAWGSGAHNSCGHVDNVEVMTHLASWGFVAYVPKPSPEPYPGDERALLGAMLWALHRDDDPSSMLHRRVARDGLGMAGYSLGGGRIVRGLADANSRRRSDGDGFDGFDGFDGDVLRARPCRDDDRFRDTRDRSRDTRDRSRDTRARCRDTRDRSRDTRDRLRDTRDRFPRQRFDLRRRFDPSPFGARFDDVRRRRVRRVALRRRRDASGMERGSRGWISRAVPVPDDRRRSRGWAVVGDATARL